MNLLVIALLGAALGADQPTAATNALKRAESISASSKSTNTNDPVEKAFRALMSADDAAQDEVQTWIEDNQKFAAKGAGLSETALKGKIHDRLDRVKNSYEAFLKSHPEHAGARLAYGSFLNDIGEEGGAVMHWEKARELDPSNPASWNNLANYYGHRGPVAKAFTYYDKARELNPNEPVYCQNQATTVFLFRKDAMFYYNINEQQVFDKALELYQKAITLDPKSLPLATDVAQTYYGIKPPRVNEAMKAWNYALSLAATSDEKQGIYLHMARWELNDGRFQEARTHLDSVTNSMYVELKKRLERNLAEKQAKAASPAP